MCFYIEEWHNLPRIATEDIVCYKVGYRTTILNTETEIEVFKSVYQDYIYQLNSKQPEIQLNPHYDDIAQGLNVIREGYHSYHDLATARLDTYPDNVIVRCIIPKGATYYYNPIDDAYVSSSLIVTNFLTN